MNLDRASAVNLDLLPPETLANLRRADRLWSQLRTQGLDVPSVVSEAEGAIAQIDWDVVICGGTLGILAAAVLQQQGWRVVVVERGILKGREQEWNISRQELQTFVELNLLSPAELERAIATEYNPARVSFHQGDDVWVEGVLNLGVDPVFLLETLKQKFLSAGGKLLEQTAFKSAQIRENGVVVTVGDQQLSTRLLIDAMGHFSPIVKQARKGEKPEGVCLVVGSCARGYPQNTTGDLIVSFTDIEHQCQYFWEAFPAKSGRTTYLFTYLDAHPQRFSLEFLMAEYLRLLPQYQNVELSQLQFERFLFGFFPSYRQSPLKLTWNYILPIGDSSGGQSPVSFGGFGAMVRNLQRLSAGINEALKVDTLDYKSLALLQPYQPNIAVTWMFQKAMSVEVDRQVNPAEINRLMSAVFAVMKRLGDGTIKPFLQDVIQFIPLAKTLPLVNPLLVFPMVPRLGIGLLLDWLIHYLNLAIYTLLFYLGNLLQPIAINFLTEKQKYYYHRWLDSWQYGSGLDYHRDRPKLEVK